MIYVHDRKPELVHDTIRGGRALQHAYDDEIKEVMLGQYDMVFKHPRSDERYKDLKQLKYVSADTPNDRQLFTIEKVTRKQEHVEVYARHVFFDLERKTLSALHLAGADGQTAVNEFITNIREDSHFTALSDIKEHHQFNVTNVSALEALWDGERSLVGLWNAELKRDNYDVQLLKRAGNDTSYLIAQRKNIDDIELTSDTKDLVTQLHLSIPDTGISVSLDSPLISEYPQVFSRVVEVKDDDVKTRDDLIKYGQNIFESQRIDMPKESFRITPSKEVNKYNFKLYDTAIVYYKDYDIHVRLPIVEYTYSPMEKAHKSIVFGSQDLTLSKALINKTDKRTASAISDAMRNATVGSVLKLGESVTIEGLANRTKIKTPEAVGSKKGILIDVNGAQNTPDYGLNIYHASDLDGKSTNTTANIVNVHGYMSTDGINNMRVVNTSIGSTPASGFAHWDNSVIRPSLVFSGAKGGENDIFYVYDGKRHSLYHAVVNAQSDSRLKKNIKKSTEKALDIIDQLKFKQFDWRNESPTGVVKPHTKIGLIAQDVQEICPGLVFDNGSYLALDVLQLTQIALKGVAELKERVVTLEKQNKELTKKLNEKDNV